MNFLHKFGQAVVKGLQIVAALEGLNIPGLSLAPKVAGELQKVESGLQKLMSIVMGVEAMGQALANKGTALTGEQLLTMEAALGEQVFLEVLKDLNTKFQIKDEALFKEGVSEALNGIVKVLKSGHEDAIQTTDVSA